MPKISIITPCYNSELYIGDTIKSVQNQTANDWEHVVVDDGSTDHSAEVIESLASSTPHLRLVRQTNGGVSKARNVGFKNVARDSQYLLFLDADDILEPNMLEVLSSYLDEHPEVGMAYCDVSHIDSHGAPIDRSHPSIFWTDRTVPWLLGVRRLAATEAETPFCSIFALASILPSMSLIRRSVYEKSSGFDEDFGHICEDTDLYLRLSLISPVHYIPQKLVRYRFHPTQSTSQADKISHQQDKLYEKWSRTDMYTSGQRRTISHAHWFRNHRLIPVTGFSVALSHLKKGQVGVAVRFFLGAFRRYRPLPAYRR